MSIASQITRLQTAKNDIKSKVNSYLPSTITSELIDTYDDKIATVIDKYRNNCPSSTVTNGICTNALDVPVKNYNVYGNSTQDGTPDPDNPAEITSVGDLVTSGEYVGKYKIPVTVSGKNLGTFNFSKAVYLKSDGTENRYYAERSGLDETYYKIYGAGQTLYITGKNISSNQIRWARCYINWYDKEFNNISQVTPIYDLVIQSNSTFSKQTSIPSNAKYFRISLHNIQEYIDGSYQTAINIQEKFNDCIGNLMFNMISSSETYEPYRTATTTDIYLDEPLRGIGTTKDYIDFVTQKRHNLIKKVIFNGSKNWQQSSFTNETIYSVYVVISDYSNNGILVSNLFEWISSASQSTISEYISTGGASIRIGILKSRLNGNTINDFKQWMANNNTEVIYELETPIEENIFLPQINFKEGTNIVTIETAVAATQQIVYITKGGS